MEKKAKPAGSLRRRWLTNTAGVILALGLVCVFGITALFAAYYYSGMEADLRSRARTTREVFSDYVNPDYGDFYQSCITYTKTFADRNSIELQFINRSGEIVASSYGELIFSSAGTAEVEKAMQSRGIETYVGRAADTGERIIAVSSPMIFSNGEVMGVLRYVTSTRLVDRQIAYVALYSLLALMVILAIVIFVSWGFIGTVMTPINQITEKARRIAAGSYGTQITTKYDDEIRGLADTINEMSAKISQNETMQAEFISQLSHELRTPLTVINGWSETLLADETLDPQTGQGLKIISSEAKRLTEMVTELLDFTRMQDGRMTLAVETADIRAEFEDTVYLYSSRLEKNEIRLNYQESDAEIPEIPCDRKRLRQVFLNILDNAVKHGGNGRQIDASIACDEESVIIKIRDYGPGIPEDELPLVKMKFYKGSSKARGTGIGLAVCDEIVTLHGGTLTLENACGGGTCVTITLPCSQ